MNVKREKSLQVGKALSACVLAWILSACGSQQFNTLATSQLAPAAGAFQIPPKVDVVFLEDDTGRIQDNYPQISQDAQAFLNTLDSENWNYHFTTLRLTTPQTIVTQAASSKQDPNWGSQWTPAYPGEVMGSFPGNEDALSPSIFRMLSNYSGFLLPGEATNALNGSEPGFATLVGDVASGQFNGTNFFRPDALTAVVLLSTGNDSSYVNYCFNGSYYAACETVTSNICQTNAQGIPEVNGQVYPLGYQFPSNTPAAGLCGSSNLSNNYILRELQGIKANPAQLKFYAATASFNSSTSGELLCQGGHATPGTRYQQIAADLAGQSYDVCSQPLSSILTDVAQNLTTTALDYVTEYIVLAEQPNPSTIQVMKNGVAIPNDPSNGWTYAGYLSNVASIIEPVPTNYESGYMIQLNGSAQLSGPDTASVIYKTVTGSTASQ
jgi:hypothetical protein